MARFHRGAGDDRASLFLGEKFVNFFDKLHESVRVLLRGGLFRKSHPPFFRFTLHVRKTL